MQRAEQAFEEDKRRAEEELRKLREAVRKAKVDTGAAVQAEVDEMERAAEQRAAELIAQHEAAIAKLQAVRTFEPPPLLYSLPSS